MLLQMFEHSGFIPFSKTSVNHYFAISRNCLLTIILFQVPKMCL